MKQEPVAFMNPTGLEYKQPEKDFMYNDCLYPKNRNWIPLYIAPQGDGEVCGGCGAIRYDPICEPAPRELSDEEIKAVYLEISEPFEGGKRLYDIYTFARAILKKASEK